MSGSPLSRAGPVRRPAWGATGCADGLAWCGEGVAGLSRGPALCTIVILATIRSKWGGDGASKSSDGEGMGHQNLVSNDPANN